MYTHGKNEYGRRLIWDGQRIRRELEGNSVREKGEAAANAR